MSRIPLGDYEKQRIATLYQLGMNKHQIAEAVGRTPQTVRKVLRDSGVYQEQPLQEPPPTEEEIAARAAKIRDGWTEEQELKRRVIPPIPAGVPCVDDLLHKKVSRSIGTD